MGARAETSGDVWIAVTPVETHGNFSKLNVKHGDAKKLVDKRGKERKRNETHGYLWKHVRSPGNLREGFEARGYAWKPAKSLVSLWKRAGSQLKGTKKHAAG